MNKWAPLEGLYGGYFPWRRGLSQHMKLTLEFYSLSWMDQFSLTYLQRPLFSWDFEKLVYARTSRMIKRALQSAHLGLLRTRAGHLQAPMPATGPASLRTAEAQSRHPVPMTLLYRSHSGSAGLTMTCSFTGSTFFTMIDACRACVAITPSSHEAISGIADDHETIDWQS